MYLLNTKTMLHQNIQKPNTVQYLKAHLSKWVRCHVLYKLVGSAIRIQGNTPHINTLQDRG